MDVKSFFGEKGVNFKGNIKEIEPEDMINFEGSLCYFLEHR
jgi:hypothetical protein